MASTGLRGSTKPPATVEKTVVSSLYWRVVTGTLLGVALAAGTLFLPTAWVGLLLGPFLLIGAWEWTFLAGVRRRITRISTLVACSGGALLLASLQNPLLLTTVIGSAVCVWILALALVVRYQFRDQLPVTAPLTDSALGGFFLAVSWVALVDLHARGGEYLLMLFAIVWGADISAYLVGGRIGRHKLARRVSPGKSWEGLMAAFVGAMLCALALNGAPLFGVASLQLPIIFLVPLVILTVGFSVVGDLFESLLKRRVGRKDSGSLLPGHGGVLDRIDAMIAASAVFWLCLALNPL